MLLGNRDEFANFGKTERKQARVMNESEATHVGFAVDPVAAHVRPAVPPWGLRNEPDLFVVTNGLDRESRGLGGLSDRKLPNFHGDLPFRIFC